MLEIPESHRLVIIVSGGMIQSVYTTLSANVTIEVLDFDDNGTQTKTEQNTKKAQLAEVAMTQRQIYG